MAIENDIVRKITSFPANGLTGRRKIKTPVKEITRDNVVEVVQKALSAHAQNSAEIEYLYDIYRGKQDVLQKVKHVREEINNIVIVNRANEIVTFKTAYLLRAPVRYVTHSKDESVSAYVNALNEMMRAEDKESKDKEIVDWMHICGVGERLTLPDPDDEREGAPFKIYTLDPRNAFVIYHAGIDEKPLAGVILAEDEDEKPIFNVYTKTRLFVIKGDTVTEEPHIINEVPLVEYLNNEARIGAFEVVLSILNNINTLESNAVDNVEDFVNAFDVFQNCEIDAEAYQRLAVGDQALLIKSTGSGQGDSSKVYRISSELSQAGVQTRIDDLTTAYLEICGMPNRNGGSSTSDTGTAVMFRDGWSDADSRAKDTETMFKRSERMFDKIVLQLTKDEIKLKLSDFEPKFPRENLSNLQSKTQVLCEMLNNNMIHPKYAFEKCGMFDDVEEAYTASMSYHDRLQAEQEAELERELSDARTEALRAGRSNDSGTQSESNSEI